MNKRINTEDQEARRIAEKWCESKGVGWRVTQQLGRGGTAPVFEIKHPDDGLRALKIYDRSFSSGEKGEIELARISQQIKLKDHSCPSLVQVYDGGNFEDRLFVLMSRAPGNELEKRLADVPREKIRSIVDQVANAVVFLKEKDICHRDIKSANIFISEDFEQATLLDISVIRDVNDPLGIGTDHDGQQPVLATARYSPPEYLFRLIEPDMKLWNALDIYQLGALLHDLIMRKPMFQEEYERSRENRYRFAWVVATVDPEVRADDVDHDLLFLAKRALDKDWERRSFIEIEEFMAGDSSRRTHALQLIGLQRSSSNHERMTDKNLHRKKIQEVASGFDEAMKNELKDQGVTSTHTLTPLQKDTEKRLTFEWNAPDSAGRDETQIRFDLTLSLQEQFGKIFFKITAILSRRAKDYSKDASMELPPVEDKEDIITILVSDVFSALEKLAEKLIKQDDN